MNPTPITITPPEGYEVCPTSTQTEIRFRPISKNKPKWEDFGKITGYYVGSQSSILLVNGDALYNNMNVWPTKEEAEACLALSQLCQWRDKYNEGWKPKFLAGHRQDTIEVIGNIVEKSCTTGRSAILTFKTGEIRDKFLDDFKDLIEIAKPLL